MTAALLHDVVDDTPVALEAVAEHFGARIAGIVAQVSQLSNTNQLLRRQRRKQARGRSLPCADLARGVHIHQPTALLLEEPRACLPPLPAHKCAEHAMAWSARVYDQAWLAVLPDGL